MDRSQTWEWIVQERHQLAGVLADLSPAEWDTPSRCAGWTVRDVAAHVIASPQLSAPAMLRTFPSLARYGYNGMILRDGQRRGRASTESILADFARWSGVRRAPFGLTPAEPLVDILVHTQDILRPLGRVHRPPVAAAMAAADRARRLGFLLGSRRTVGMVRMVATDADWARGAGPLVQAPMEELLMLCAGRPPRWEACAGPGVEALRARTLQDH
ncbi:maleylpyruvate isomerase family mycothiol-dependent enzyme [Brevibacterium daeguense]|uniref:Maleylpyruvate isomerase family mycothiol-dependent enzyme n=1 Tax=Brevibacterium daeguense TaxID=909936 RepID=A0ABP8EML3_9MICO|nr:maleylpyruvate isomerase family mycothiol-dependent enzyme [Brevibacterium daeguense]